MIEIENTTVKNFELQDSGIISLKKLTNFLGLENVRTLTNVLPDSTLIIRLGKLSNSMINLSELQTSLVSIGVIQNPKQVETPASVIESPPIVKTPIPSAIVITDTKNDYVKKLLPKRSLKLILKN